jgi:asparagine synthase (glutamine-hydrolysing)
MDIKARAQTWLASAALSADARRVRAEGLTYLSPTKFRRLERALAQALSQTTNGDVLEFGIALGGSALVIGKQALDADRRFAGFDVFGMIPPPTSDHDDAKSKERYQIIASGRSEGIGGQAYYGYRTDLYGEVCATFQRHQVPVDGDKVQLIKGLFEETWPYFDGTAIAFAHIDCDWHDPVKYCLEAVATKIVPGGMMVMDDYNDYGGCRAAVDEFMIAHSDFAFQPGENPIIHRL